MQRTELLKPFKRYCYSICGYKVWDTTGNLRRFNSSEEEQADAFYEAELDKYNNQDN